MIGQVCGVRGWLALGGLLAMVVGAAGCSEDLLADGDPCEKAQDCEGSLRCAYAEEDGKIQVCAPADRTRPERDCVPGAEAKPCGLVLLRDEGQICKRPDDCLEGLRCQLADDPDMPDLCVPDEDIDSPDGGM